MSLKFKPEDFEWRDGYELNKTLSTAQASERAQQLYDYWLNQQTVVYGIRDNRMEDPDNTFWHKDKVEAEEMGDKKVELRAHLVGIEEITSVRNKFTLEDFRVALTQTPLKDMPQAIVDAANKWLEDRGVTIEEK